ncbi:UNVERIFIED_CONTAM: hypothetical protein QML36_09785, partial [Aerococcus urinaeequi]
FPSFCIRSGLHALRISCPFCVHKNSVNEIQYEFSPTLFIIEPIKSCIAKLENESAIWEIAHIV